jgi:hypothetical protein
MDQSAGPDPVGTKQGLTNSLAQSAANRNGVPYITCMKCGPTIRGSLRSDRGSQYYGVGASWTMACTLPRISKSAPGPVVDLDEQNASPRQMIGGDARCTRARSPRGTSTRSIKLLPPHSLDRQEVRAIAIHAPAT